MLSQSVYFLALFLDSQSSNRLTSTCAHTFDSNSKLTTAFWFDLVCVEVLRPSQLNGVMSSVVSLPNHTFTGHA